MRSSTGLDNPFRLRRKHLVAVLAGALLMPLPAPAPADAHGDVHVTICIPVYRGGRCARRSDRPSYIYGQTIVVKGRTLQNHGGTIEIMRTKGGAPWQVVARRRLVDSHYRYEWHTTEDDIDQGTPYRFKTHLPDHDYSRVQKVYVLFRE